MLLKINGNTINFTKDYTLLQICDSIGVRIPRFCYNDQMSIAGNCRMCLVELKGGPKPLVSCTSKGIPNMEIYTESPLVKKAREGVLEFLLANHPLDCPICDQGGECDLQDQSEKFGGDSSRSFLFFKRPVQDKDMGLFIKTIMVRCIHCTRCIRFLKDKALTNDLGTIGRGEKTEISFYFQKFLDKSLLSGNIVDICPVGALTNKDYSFKGRPWEIDEIKYLGISDTLGLGMKIGIKRGMNKIIRVIPTFTTDTGTKLISDFTRHCIDGIVLDRIENKSFKSNNIRKNISNYKLYEKLIPVTLAKSLSSYKFTKIFDEKFLAIIGPYTSLKDLFYLSFTNSEKGSVFWSHVSFLNKKINSIYPFLYQSNLSLDKFVSLDKKTLNYGKKIYSLKDFRHKFFIIGTDFLSEFPSLSSKIIKSFSSYILSRDSFCLGLLPYKKNNPYFSFKKGLGTCILIDILEGRSILCKNIVKNLNSFIFFSMLLKRRFDGNFIHIFANNLLFLKGSTGVLSSIPSETSSCNLSNYKSNLILDKENYLFNNNSFHNFYNFKNLDLGLFNDIKSNNIFCIGEISEKIIKLPIKLPVFVWTYLSNFNSRNTIFKQNNFNKSILGKMILPKIFFLEESFDFITTLGSYKKNFWSPLSSNFSQFNLKNILKLDSNLDLCFKYFILNSNDNLNLSNVNSFQIYTKKNYIYLTEFKSLSKENLFQEDTFLKKSPRLIKLISFFRLSHNSFKH